MFASRPRKISRRVLGAVDLAIDLGTLGEYGLEPVPADEPCRERPGPATGWEALPAARPRGTCGHFGAAGASRPAAATHAGRVRRALAA